MSGRPQGARPQSAPAQIKPDSERIARQFISFSYYKLDPAWRHLPADEQARGRAEWLEAVREFEGSGTVLVPYSCVGMRAEHDELRTTIKPGRGKYIFVYPFVKSREWYLLHKQTRQGIMDEHIEIGNKYPSVKLNTTYSFGIDDQDFVVAFEGDYPEDFIDLVMELRESDGSKYTVRDTPIITGIKGTLEEILDTL